MVPALTPSPPNTETLSLSLPPREIETDEFTPMVVLILLIFSSFVPRTFGILDRY